MGLHMSQFEMMVIAQENWSNAIAISAIVMSLLSGYLVVAYTAAKKMTVSQVTIVNILYSGLTLFTMASFAKFVSNAGYWGYLAMSEQTRQATEPNIFLAYTIAGFLCFCFLASLKFMWDVRHPKAN